MTTQRARRALVALAATLTLALSSCGEEPTDGAAEVSATEHSAADVDFATGMIQHHAQALSMVDLTRGRALDPEVERLAEDIRAAQAPEIEMMVDWLQEWGEEVPETMRDHSNAGHGEDHPDPAESMEGMDTDLPGMMSAEDMTDLAEAPDAEFQALWLEMMVEHHEGAVEMAEAAQEDGRYEPAVDLARSIEDAQAAEIETMEALLDRLT